jgi:hypothetical protein
MTVWLFLNSYAPRFHVGIHMRCQFSSFEANVGPEDGQYWLNAVKERDDWLNSTGVIWNLLEIIE